MGAFKHLLSAMVLLSYVMVIQSMTIREALRVHIDNTPSLSNIDVALGKMADAPDSASISDSDLEFLRDVLGYIPDTHPTVINSVLHGEQLKDVVQHVMDQPLEGLLEGLERVGEELGLSAPCLAGGDAGGCYGNISDVTTTMSPGADDYKLCSTDLRPLYSPIVYFVFDYIYNMINNVQKNIPKLRFFECWGPLQYALYKVDDLRRQWPAGFSNGWEIRFLDAMAKPPTAILGGQLQWVGGYEVCQKIKVTNISDDDYKSTRSFNGKYCRVMIGQVNNSLPVELNLGFGLCLPDTCTTDGTIEYLTENPGLLSAVLGMVGFEVKSVFCGNVLEFSTDSRAQLAIGIILTLVIVVILATVYDLAIRPIIIKMWAPEDSLNSSIQGGKYTASYSDIQMMPAATNGHISAVNGHIPSPELRIVDRQSSVVSTKSLLSDVLPSDTDNSLSESAGLLDRMEAAFAGFSAATSFRKIFDVRNLGPHHMPCVDALRFLSVVYAIGGNTCLFGILYTESMTASNLVDKLMELPHMFAFQPVINYSFSADTFLVVSGTVISYHWLRRLHKAGGKLGFKQILHFYIHRYWSLMPAMMFTIMTYTCLYKYLLSGPISPPQITDAENCRTNWWVNLLMLGNLVNTNNQCLAWTWFAPLLFQLQIVTPIILIPLSYKRWAGWISLGSMYIIFIATVSGIVKNQIYGDIGLWYTDYIQTPWCRAGPYLIGVAVGILLYDRIPHKIPRNILTKLISWVLWVVAVGSILLCAFITYTKYREEDPVKWTEDQTVTYHVFIRSVWGLAIAYMIIACQTGFGGFFNSTLSHTCFTPGSRIAYPVFVVHAIFIFKYAYSQFDTIYINFNNLLYIFFGHLIMVYLIGLLIAIVFFYPFQGLEYAFFGAKTKLDIITAGSCEQSFRDLQTQREHMEEIEEQEPEDPSVTNVQNVSFM